MRPRRRLLYADSSALVKLLVEEPETKALRGFLGASSFELATCALAQVEVQRAVTIADPAPDTGERIQQLLDGCVLLAVDPLLERARTLASVRVRTLDAIHLAAAEASQPSAVLAYDEHLAESARELGLAVEQPGR